jgi:hypothetical protein
MHIIGKQPFQPVSVSYEPETIIVLFFFYFGDLFLAGEYRSIRLF